MIDYTDIKLQFVSRIDVKLTCSSGQVMEEGAASTALHIKLLFKIAAIPNLRIRSFQPK